ncbi:Pantothenate synthetase [Corynebacterium ciconiae DSM 44920]|uniref:pantoate--beta-alanine ligase n=1 Tax=Corynebacterium ciconiae TaxID=227319 RepID=UPI00037FF750|nr:pantoate--beta-alanine ligase [Corynebacterium ciconiae]WKD61960.1 Pantothenate synthetase [Corynebacterium ciconiae DSM 44920]
MAFEPGAARVIDSPDLLRTFASAMRKTGRPVVLVPLAEPWAPQHVALVRAARSVPRAVVVLVGECSEEHARELGVDASVPGLDAPRITLALDSAGLEQLEERASLMLRLLVLVNPHVVVLSERDYEFLLLTQRLISEYGFTASVRGVPPTRSASGVALQPALADLGPEQLERAMVLSAALLAATHRAEEGAEAVLATARELLGADDGVDVEYVELRDARTFGPPPERGDARLLVAATIDGVRVIDNVGVPVGIGFKNLNTENGV